MDLAIERVLDGDGNFLHWDIFFDSGSLQTVSRKLEIANRLICNLSVYIGENFTDVSFGTDYHNNIFGHDVTDIVTIDTLKASALNTRGVISIKTFSLVLDGDRIGQMTSTVLTTEGEIEITTPIQL
jgi:hypothetical protein